MPVRKRSLDGAGSIAESTQTPVLQWQAKPARFDVHSAAG